MPLALKTLQEVSVELGIPEAELKALVQLQKIRGMMKRGKLVFAPDEIAKIKRQRKSLPESAKETVAPPIVPKPSVPPKPPPPRTPPRRFPSRPTDL